MSGRPLRGSLLPLLRDVLFFPPILVHNVPGSDQRYWHMPMKRLSLAAVFALAVTAPPPAWADLAGALALLQEAQYDKALAELKPLAEGGDGEAQFHMGEMFENGWGVQASYQQALDWYRRAADRGHVEAMLRVADFNRDGMGGPRSRREAYDWYLKAAQKGQPHAMALVGRWNLEGTAKRPDFLTAKLWLNKAVAAGDAEAQGIVDTLASKNFPILDIPGTTEPTEEAAQRVLAEVKNLLEPMEQAPPGSTRLKLGQPATIIKEGDGQLVTLPMVELTTSAGSFRLGTIQMLFNAIGDDYTVELRLPSLSRQMAPDGHERGHMKIDGRKISGVWSSSLHTLTDYTAELTGLKYVSSEGMPWTMTIHSITAKRSYTPLGEGRFDVADTAEATGLRTEGGTAPEQRVMTLASAAYDVRYTGLDVQALAQVAQQFGIDWRTRVLMAGVSGRDLPESVPPLLGAVELSLKASDMVAKDGSGEPVGALGHAELTLSASDLDKPQSTLALHYAHDGMAGSGETVLLPKSAEITLSGRHVPFGTILSAGLSWWRGTPKPGRKPMPGVTPFALPDLTKVSEPLLSAKSELRIDKARLTGEGYSVTLSGTLTPEPAGKLEMAIKGLDTLTGTEPPPILAPGEEAPPTWNPLELLTRVKTSAADDHGSKIFRVTLSPDSKITVNGKDVTKLLGR